MRRLILAAPLCLAPFACVEPPPDLQPSDHRAVIPAAPDPDVGFQIIGPEIVIPAGQDKMLCWVPDVVFDHDVVIKDFATFQGELGHHLFGMKSAIPRQAGEQFDCTNVDQMSTIEPLISPTSGNNEGTGSLLSDEFAIRVSAGVQLVMQSHYVNITDEDILIRDAANFQYLGADEQRVEANYLVLNDDTLDIPADNAPYTNTSECTLTQPFQFASVMGHMHEWGKQIKIERIQPNGTITSMYEVPEWSAAYRDAPPVTRWSVAEPMAFEAGDKLRVTCEWQNNTADALRFPEEMCVSLLVYFPALPDGFIVCD